MLFDSGCVVCGATPGPVCPGCESALVVAHGLCSNGLDVCRGAFELDEKSRAIIAALKYHRQRRLAGWLAARMVDDVPRAADALTWVPATPERRRRRGFDQARELAVGLARRTGIPAVGLFTRAPADQRQTGQSRVARQAGPALRLRRPSPPFVVIVDDVLTTGSSLRVAADRLRTGGAIRVVGVVAAATPLDRQIGSPHSRDSV